MIQLIRHEKGLESPRILDLCTGSGCIAATIAHQVKGSIVLATEINPAAAGLARRNIQRLGLSERVTVMEGDLFQPLEQTIDRLPFQLIVANPPYVPTGQIAGLDRNVRDFEPVAALDGGLDGLAIHRRILQQAPAKLSPGGHIFLEIAFDQGELAIELAKEHAEFIEAKVLKDHGGNDRVLTARIKPE